MRADLGLTLSHWVIFTELSQKIRGSMCRRYMFTLPKPEPRPIQSELWVVYFL